MCNCRNGNSTPATQTPAQQYEVTLPSGERVMASSDHEARVLITRAGGGTFSRK